jgi:GntR family transcriptional regulator
MILDKQTVPSPTAAAAVPSDPAPLLEFHLDPRTGVPPYLQLVHQVEGAVRLGILGAGDQLPTVKDVVAALAINPNTVLKAYRELEHRGLAAGRPGQGTFVQESIAHRPAPGRQVLRESFAEWLISASAAGLSEADMRALIEAELLAARRVDGAA